MSTWVRFKKKPHIRLLSPPNLASQSERRVKECTRLSTAGVDGVGNRGEHGGVDQIGRMLAPVAQDARVGVVLVEESPRPESLDVLGLELDQVHAVVGEEGAQRQAVPPGDPLVQAHEDVHEGRRGEAVRDQVQPLGDPQGDLEVGAPEGDQEGRPAFEGGPLHVQVGRDQAELGVGVVGVVLGIAVADVQDAGKGSGVLDPVAAGIELHVLDQRGIEDGGAAAQLERIVDHGVVQVEEGLVGGAAADEEQRGDLAGRHHARQAAHHPDGVLHGAGAVDDHLVGNQVDGDLGAAGGLALLPLRGDDDFLAVDGLLGGQQPDLHLLVGAADLLGEGFVSGQRDGHPVAAPVDPDDGKPPLLVGDRGFLGGLEGNQGAPDRLAGVYVAHRAGDDIGCAVAGDGRHGKHRRQQQPGQ
jgi:hypothetical protein